MLQSQQTLWKSRPLLIQDQLQKQEMGKWREGRTRKRGGTAVQMATVKTHSRLKGPAAGAKRLRIRDAAAANEALVNELSRSL